MNSGNYEANFEIYDEMDCVTEKYISVPVARDDVVNEYGEDMVRRVSKMIDSLDISDRLEKYHLKKHNAQQLMGIDTTSPKFSGVYFDEKTQKKCINKVIGCYRWDIIQNICGILSGKLNKHKFAINFYDDNDIGYYTCYSYVVKTPYYKVTFQVKNNKLKFVSSYPIPYLEQNNKKKDKDHEIMQEIIGNHNYDGRIINGEIVLESGNNKYIRGIYNDRRE